MKSPRDSLSAYVANLKFVAPDHLDERRIFSSKFLRLNGAKTRPIFLAMLMTNCTAFKSNERSW
jgi:hypothetical protein